MIHTSMLQKHIQKVKFYPSADDFTQALLVTNIMSVKKLGIPCEAEKAVRKHGALWHDAFSCLATPVQKGNYIICYYCKH